MNEVKTELRNCPWCFCEMRIERHGNMYYPIGPHDGECIMGCCEVTYIGSQQGLEDLVRNWNRDGYKDDAIKQNREDADKWNKLGFGD